MMVLNNAKVVALTATYVKCSMYSLLLNKFVIHAQQDFI